MANNALSHGLCSTRNVLPGENALEYEQYRDELWRDVAPQGALEEMLLERIVNAGWRLRRAVRVETELIDLAGAPARRKAFLGPSRLLDAPAPQPEHELGIAFATGAAAALDRVGRYETRVERSLLRTLHELERLQLRRAGTPVAPPIAIDVDIAMPNSELQSSDPLATEGAEVADEHPSLMEDLLNGFVSLRRG